MKGQNMNDDLLVLINKLRAARNMDEVEEVKELGESFLRRQKRAALLTLLAISEETGDNKILESIAEMASYLEKAKEVREKR